MKKTLFLGVLTIFIFFAFPAPEAKAFDPVTISLLAPIAIKAAQIAAPYIIRGLKNFGKGCIKVGKDMIDFFRLPLGLGQVLFLAPFGYFNSGVRNLVLGGVAPLKLCIHTLILPLLLFGANINI
ncbi:MAG: hypothetical protein A2020_03730 [Lentisphaerae bacterium GWF2_45_14]|nr:MAG: hypothetical protein A2020_03730 [Lentisphaerae bacterium GWF2_45_14]